MPVWQLLGGKARDHIELYSTVFPRPQGGTLEDAARACRDAGFRIYRYATDNPRQRVVDRFKLVRKMYDDCVLLHKGAGDGGWAIDFHTELDLPDAINLATLLEPLHPYFCEDLIRSENVLSYETVRQRTKVPIAVGEQFGYKWDVNALIEKQLIDYTRVTLPNVGGITEFMKIVALAETHYIGMIPHFTGPIAEAALVHCLAATSVIALMEMLGNGTRTWPYLPKAYDFKDGKLWPNDRPGLGVQVDMSKLTQNRRVRQVSRRNVPQPAPRRIVHKLVERTLSVTRPHRYFGGTEDDRFVESSRCRHARARRYGGRAALGSTNTPRAGAVVAVRAWARRPSRCLELRDCGQDPRGAHDSEDGPDL